MDSYVDPDYDIKFAVKRAKKDLDERDLQRFKQEFEVLKKLSFPYVVEVYRHDEAHNEYRLEYCDTTLRDPPRYKEREAGLCRRGSASRSSFSTASTTCTTRDCFTATSVSRTSC